MSSYHVKAASSVIPLFAKAAIEPARWMGALGTMASATRSARAQLIGLDFSGALVCNFVTDVGADFDEDFQAIPGSHDPQMNFRVAASSAPDEIIHERHYDEARAMTGYTAYEEMCERHGIPLGCQTVLATEQGMMTGLALLRTRSDGPTSEDDRALFRQIAPSARAAARLQRDLEQGGTALVRGALDAVSAPALLIDGYRRVIDMTPAAQRALAMTARLDVRAQMLVASLPAQTNAIQSALGAVLSGRSLEETIILRGGGDAPLGLAIQPLPRMDWNMGFCPRAIVILKGLAAERGDVKRALQMEFGLTAAEADIAALLAAGLPRQQIADMRGASLGTVRQQIKAIFAKLHVSREAEFMTLVGLFTP